MQWFLYLMGVLWVSLGTWMILYTGHYRKFCKKLVKNVNELFLILLNIVIGILFIVAAFYSHKFWIIASLGILCLAEGILYVLNPGKIYQKVRDWYLLKASDQTYRLMGIIVLILGTALFSWV